MEYIMDPEYRARRRALYSKASDYWRCPNTGRVIAGMSHDNKVICWCQKQNPKLPVPHHGGTYEHGHENGGPICHIKKFLDQATVDEFLAQEDREVARRN